MLGQELSRIVFLPLPILWGLPSSGLEKRKNIKCSKIWMCHIPHGSSYSLTPLSVPPGLCKLEFPREMS